VTSHLEDEPSLGSEALTTLREQMVEDQVRARGVQDPAVLAALERVPRHLFVQTQDREWAYSDRPLPIPGGQTISQPYIVGLMSEAAHASQARRCLEIGTGSGYQTAVLAELCPEVFSIEFVAETARFGHANLRAAGYYDRVHLRVGDGFDGWPEAAPFDTILVTAAPPDVPQPLLDQLAVHGKLVVPVGQPSAIQELQVWTRRSAGSEREAFEVQSLFGVRFVPFLGGRLGER
jgi:protein-L-isoaspartate(D-aspartate) O-methyltransferase